MTSDQWWLSPEGARNDMHRIQPKLSELRQRAHRDHDA
jgi:hypothetical protein